MAGFRLDRDRLPDVGQWQLASTSRRFTVDHQGDRVVLQADDSGIHITTIDQAVKNAQAICARYIKPGVSVVDELIRERREEAARE